jgi:hypothetical protein
MADGAYSFTAEPQAVKAKYRPTGADADGGLGIQNDPRVARGSTHGGANAGLGGAQLARGKGKGKNKPTPMLRRPDVFGVQPVPKAQQQLDLSIYLVEQVDAPETSDASDQTDTFRPKAPVRNYYTRSLPARSGVDAATQVDEALFDFDLEVAPLLGVLVDKTLEAALCEVEEEEELAAIRAAKAGHMAGAEQERARVEAVERAARGTEEQKGARVAAERRRVAEEEALRLRVLAAVQGRLLAEAARAAATAALYADGTFFDVEQRMVEADFMEGLYGAADAKTAGIATAQAALDAALAEALRQQRIRQDTWWLGKLAGDAAAGAAQDPLLPPPPPPVEGGELPGLEEGFIRIFLKGAPLGVPDMIGPIAVDGGETLEQTEEKIQAWLVENVGADFVPPEGGYLKFAVDGNELQRDATLLDAGVADEATLDVL